MIETLSARQHVGDHRSEPVSVPDAAPLPTERLEAEICSLAGHLAAATCRFIDLIADYDERRAWAAWEMRSCAEWLSWLCWPRGTTPWNPRCPDRPGTAEPAVHPPRVRRRADVLLQGPGADIYQVIVHTTPDMLGGGVPAGKRSPDPADVPHGTPDHPCRPGRCHLEDGPAIAAEDVQLIACDATISAMTHDTDGTILSVGQRTRKVPPAIRRAVRERDGARCAFPGCNSRRVDLHHIVWWSNGGQTSLDNLMNLCRTHHRLVHAKAFIITRGPGGSYTFTDPATGTATGPAGPLPARTAASPGPTPRSSPPPPSSKPAARNWTCTTPYGPPSTTGTTPAKAHAASTTSPSLTSKPRHNPAASLLRVSVEEWLRVRRYLKEHRYELGVAAADEYPSGLRVAGTPLLAPPAWRPAAPIPIDEVACEFRPDASTPALPPGPVPDGYATYAEAVASLDAPAVFENRPTFRLLDADLTARKPALTFGSGSYFDGLNTGEAAAHEFAAGDSIIRAAVGDPTDLARRPANLAISTLTLRNDGGHLSYPLHWRDPAKVGHAGGLHMVVPVGVFQPAVPDEPPDLWQAMLREFAEELGGYPEHYDRPVDPAFAGTLVRHTTSWVLGLGADPLTYATDLLTAVVIDAPVYDDLFAGTIHNDEGTVLGLYELDAPPETMQAAGAALIALANRHAGILAG